MVIHNDLMRTIFNSTEIEIIKKTTIKDRKHPLKRMLFPEQRDLQVVENTNRALGFILKADKHWILNHKGNLLTTSDYTTPSSALAEIRAYGYLLEGQFSVTPFNSGATYRKPEFLLTENNERISIEVHAKHLNDEEAKALENFHTERVQILKGRSYIFREHVVTPFGKPRLGENVTENVISKLAAIKQDESQFSQNETNILWLDFQDEIWDLVLSVNSVNPVSTWNGEWFSGGIWYAFYGWVGAPIFESHTTERRIKIPHVKMRHEGRFRIATKLDAVIVAFPRYTVILENSTSQKPIKPTVWRKLFLLPWFRFEYSYINWPNPNLKQRIKTIKKNIISLSKKVIYSW